jgi:hypothetical protein
VKKVIFGILLCIVTYVLIEMSSFAILYISGGLKNGLMIPLSVSSNTFVENNDLKTRGPDDPIFHYARHPYFGFVSRPSIKLRKFVTKNDKPKKDSSVFRIAIFGGSVAEQLGDYLKDEWKNESINKKIKNKFPCLRDKRIEFLPLGIMSSKQPQTFAVASHFIHDYDMALVLDGLNDASHHSHPQFELSYPMFSQSLYTMKEEDSVALAQFVVVSGFYKSLVSHAAFQYSYTLYLVQSLMRSYLKTLAEKATMQLRSESDEERFYQTELPREEIWKKLSRIYLKFSQLQHSLSEKYNKLHFIFLQPTPSYHKPLSKEESLFLRPDHREWHGVRAYQTLLSEVKKQNLDYVIDLTKVFSKNKETLYIDNCCHLNVKGDELLFEGMLEELTKYSNKICQLKK